MATISKYQTASGATLYRVRYRTPDNRSTQKRGFRRKVDAERFANKVEVSKMTGDYVAPIVGRTTLGYLGQRWLDRQRGHLKPASLRTYESAWQTHVEPRWGATPIARICYSDVAAWVADVSARRGAETVRNAYRVLTQILDDAVRDRMLASNVARGVTLPKSPPPHKVYLTAAQLNRLADEAGDYCSLVLLLGVGGLRWGEATALTVGDVDFLRRRVELRRNAVTVNGTVVVGTLKSHKNRTVALPQFVLDALSVTARGKGREDLLWSNRSGGYVAPPGRGSWLDFAVRRCQATDATFQRVTAHGLRHTAASLAIHAGAHPKVVQRMLGHASAAMTLDVYADLFDSDLDTVAENVAKMWPKQA